MAKFLKLNLKTSIYSQDLLKTKSSGIGQNLLQSLGIKIPIVNQDLFKLDMKTPRKDQNLNSEKNLKIKTKSGIYSKTSSSFYKRIVSGASTNYTNRKSSADTNKSPNPKFMLKKDNATKLKNTNSIKQYLEGIV